MKKSNIDPARLEAAKKLGVPRLRIDASAVPGNAHQRRLSVRERQRIKLRVQTTIALGREYIRQRREEQSP